MISGKSTGQLFGVPRLEVPDCVTRLMIGGMHGVALDLSHAVELSEAARDL